MKRWSLLIAFILACLVGTVGTVFAQQRNFGDGDHFPSSCIDFTGAWRSDDGRSYNIAQKKCSWIRIKASINSQDGETLTIVPDNKPRNISGRLWSGSVRHRWNAQDYGTNIESYTTINFSEHTVSDIVILEVVNDNLLLESTYRTITPSDGSPKQREYGQIVFRKLSGDRR